MSFGDHMQAMLATWSADDAANVSEDLSDTPTLKAALDGPEKD